jgi:AcrR family transcriptional regulator
MARHDDHRPMAHGTITRQRMIETTIRLLAAEGYSAASWRRVGKAADVSGGVLQYHFGDKQGLFEAVIEELCDRQLTAVREQLLPQHGTIRERVAAYVATSASIMAGDNEIALLELLLGTRGSADGALSQDSLDRMQTELSAIWQELLSDTVVGRKQLLAAHHLLFSALHGIEVQKLFGPQRGSHGNHEALVEAITALVHRADPIG